MSTPPPDPAPSPPKHSDTQIFRKIAAAVPLEQRVRDLESILSVTPLPRAMFSAWPSSPKPVTSVAQVTPRDSAARLATAFNARMESCSAS